ncbi:MAG: SLBB domain-containing protein [Fimbriimonadaceae bacterium]|nr:SLBB domain-containing protein [Fimbriimonadaceae bacterium]
MKLITLGLLFAAQATQTTSTPFRLKPGDEIRVVVLGYSEYVSNYIVLSDGTISGIGFGQVKAAGKTVSQLQDEVAQRLTAYIRNPKVAIVVTNERKESVFVVRGDGDASTSPTSGGFPFQPGMELRQLVALSKMPTPLDLFETRVYRGGKVFKTVHLDQLMKGEANQWNGPMEPGDLVTIMPVPMVRVWVLGLVGSPGEKRVRQGSDLYQAIASAGAVTASPDQFDEIEVMVRRGPEVLTFAPKQDFGRTPFILENGDTVIVQPPTLLKVSVGGFVAKPGDFEVKPGTTLSQAVSATAGGATEDGTLKGVYIFRGSQVFVSDALPTAGQFLLMNGDSVFVLRNQRVFTVLGEVQKPGVVKMQDDREYRLADALASASGLLEKGSLRRVYHLKPEGGKFVAKQFNLDEFLKDGKIEANPIVSPGDVVLFGQPKGVTLNNISQALNGVLVLQNLFR